MTVFKIYSRALRFLLSEKRLTAILLIASVCIGVIQVFEPVLFGRVVDSLTKTGQSFHILSLWALLGLMNIFASVFVAVMSDRLAHRQRLDVLDEVFERVIALPVSYHSENGSGRVVRAILAGSDQLFMLWLAFMRDHLSSVVGIVLLVPLALTMDWRMAALLFLLALIYVAANLRVLKETHEGQTKVEELHQDMFGRMGDVIGNVTVVQSYTRLKDEMDALQNLMADLLSAQYPVLTWWGLLNVITRISATLAMVSILGLGAWLVGRGEITVGQVVAFASFSALLISKLDQISSFVSRTMTQAPALANFFSLLDQEGAALETPNARHIQNVRGEIQFHDVVYNYPRSPRGVFNLNFKVSQGQTVALVGPSGSGKTTSLALMQRLFDPDSGKITLDGEDIRNITLSSLRHSIATVFQDAGLFNRSVDENIRVGRPSASEAEVHAAALQADAHEFVAIKPGGYSFIIGERGSKLSGGERQRLAIARAILKNAPILIFDEATSALDNETERKIQNAISRLRVDRTTFIIAHSLSTIVSADQILVFENGRIVEAGSFSELRAVNGLFARLLKAGELGHAEEPKLGSAAEILAKKDMSLDRVAEKCAGRSAAAPHEVDSPPPTLL